MKETTITIEGMSCGHCVKSVSSALGALPGVKVKKVVVGQADVSYDEATTKHEQLILTIEEEGFQVKQ